LERIPVYCPATVYLFRDMLLNDFYESDLGKQYFWEEAKAENQTDYLGTFNAAMYKYGYSRMSKEPPLSAQYAEIDRRLSQIDLMLEIRDDRIWLAAYCTADKPLSEKDMSQLKEYLAERIASRSDMISQWGYMEHGPDVLAVSFDAVDTISPSCGYPIDYDELLKNNHLLLKSELNAEAVNPVQETGTSRIQSL
jgi:hypothetical protein